LEAARDAIERNANGMAGPWRDTHGGELKKSETTISPETCDAWRLPCAALATLFLCALTACHTSRPTVLTVSAAASLTDAIQEIEASYRHDHPGIELRNNFGSSGTLAREIENGAPVDVFISAASKPMDELQASGLVVAGSRRNLLRNTLVLIAPQGSQLSSFQQLAEPSIRSIALGDPASVPAGQYGEQTLAWLHLPGRVRSRLVLAKDVRQVLAYVETGNADAGIVYATDVVTSAGVRVVATAPEASHDPIVYPAAAIASGRHEDAAREFVEYLKSEPAKAIFVKRGFTMAVQ
jgi:molybdate transport system substrate-binding protein